MAINIYDSFSVNYNGPIDNRFVVQNDAERNSITFKYDGLKVFQLNNRKTYVWNQTTNSWDIESSTGNVNSQNSTQNYIPKWLNNTYELTDSNIYCLNNKVGINTTSPSSDLDVNGVVKANMFIGDGYGLQNLNASNITSGILQITRLQNSTVAGHILMSGPNSPVWVSLSNITVNTSNNTNNVNVVYDNSSSGFSSLTFVSGTGYQQLKISQNHNIKFNPSTNEIKILGKSIVFGNNGTLSTSNTRVWFNVSPDSTNLTHNTGALQIGADKQFEFFPYYSGGTTLTIYNPTAGINNRILFSNYNTYSSYVLRQSHYFISPIEQTNNATIVRFASRDNNTQSQEEEIIMYLANSNMYNNTPGMRIKRSLWCGSNRSTCYFFFESQLDNDYCFKITNYGSNNTSGGLIINMSSNNILSKGFVVTSNTSDVFSVRTNGSVFMNSLRTGSSGFNLIIDNNGEVFKSSSSKRFKKDIIYLDDNFNALDLLQKMKPVVYKDKYSDKNLSYYGFIAEDVIEIDDKLVYYITDNNNKKIPYNVYYDKITVLLVKAVIELNKKINTIINN